MTVESLRIDADSESMSIPPASYPFKWEDEDLHRLTRPSVADSLRQNPSMESQNPRKPWNRISELASGFLGSYCNSSTIVSNGVSANFTGASSGSLSLYEEQLRRNVSACCTAAKASMSSGSTKNGSKGTTAAVEVCKEVDVLVVGGGIVGIMCVKELQDIHPNDKILLVDGGDTLGGQIANTTCRLRGIAADFPHAGMTGKEACAKLIAEIDEHKHEGNLSPKVLKKKGNVEFLHNANVVAIFSDKVVGISEQKTNRYLMVKPKQLVVASGQREGYSLFKGNMLAGVMFLQRALSLPPRMINGKKMVIVGKTDASALGALEFLKKGANILGLVIEDGGLFTGLDVNRTLLEKHGVALMENTEVVAVHSTGAKAQAITLREKHHTDTMELPVDLVVVCGEPIPANELSKKAIQWEIPTYSIGAAAGTADLSIGAAQAKLAARRIVKSLGGNMPHDKLAEAENRETFLKQHDSARDDGSVDSQIGVSIPGGPGWQAGGHKIWPVFHEQQTMNCNVCAVACPKGLIKTRKNERGAPYYDSTSRESMCDGCGDCVVKCPGGVVTIVDTSKDSENVTVKMVHQIPDPKNPLTVGVEVEIYDRKGCGLGKHKITAVQERHGSTLVSVIMPANSAARALSLWRQPDALAQSLFKSSCSGNSTTCKDCPSKRFEAEIVPDIEDTAYVCRCEKVTLGKIKQATKDIMHRTGGDSIDLNAVKQATRQGMGYCGGYQCTAAVTKFIQNKLGTKVTGDIYINNRVQRPLNMQIPFSSFAAAPLPSDNIREESGQPRLQYQLAQENNTFDVVILGAGAIGTPASLFLQETNPTLKILVLDMNPMSGQSDAKRALGGVRATFGNPGKIITGMDGIEVLRNWQKKYGDDIEWLDGGYLFPFYTEEHEKGLKALMPTQHKYGLNIGMISPEECQKLCSGIEMKGLRGGIYSPDDGRAAPYLAALAFHRVATEKGVYFRFNHRITGFLQDVKNKKITGVTCHDTATNSVTKYYARKMVINALGATTNELISTLGYTLNLFSDSHEAAVTAPCNLKITPLVVDLRSSDGAACFYFVQNKRGQLVLCTTPSPAIMGYDVNETSHFLPSLARRIIQLIPEAKDIEVRRAWRGLYANTKDGNPLVGPDMYWNNLFHAVGMGGQGFMLGPGIAKLITRIFNNEKGKYDDVILQEFDPFRKFSDKEEMLR